MLALDLAYAFGSVFPKSMETTLKYSVQMIRRAENYLNHTHLFEFKSGSYYTIYIKEEIDEENQN
jgi:hypothetical protein